MQKVDLWSTVKLQSQLSCGSFVVVRSLFLLRFDFADFQTQPKDSTTNKSEYILVNSYNFFSICSKQICYARKTKSFILWAFVASYIWVFIHQHPIFFFLAEKSLPHQHPLRNILFHGWCRLGKNRGETTNSKWYLSLTDKKVSKVATDFEQSNQGKYTFSQFWIQL